MTQQEANDKKRRAESAGREWTALTFAASGIYTISRQNCDKELVGKSKLFSVHI
jgi:cation transport regulator ChaB